MTSLTPKVMQKKASSFCVGFDVSALDEGFKSHAHRGIGRYVRELTQRFSAQARLAPESFSSESSLEVRYFDHTWINGGSAARLFDYLPAGRETLKQQIFYPWKLSSGRMRQFDLLHFPAHMDAPSWTPATYILTVLDLIPLVCKELYEAQNGGWRYKLARFFELQAIRHAALILAISENTKKDLEDYLGIPPERVVVTPLGVNDSFFAESGQPREAVCESFGLPPDRQVVLYVGGIDPRKNWRVLLKAFSILCERFREAGKVPPILALVGNIINDREYPALLRLIDSLGLREEVKELGYVSDEHLPAIYGTSDVFFFPSLYEGFGLPPLEAMAVGTPVVSSSSSAMPEVIDDAGHLFAPTDAGQAAEQLWHVLQDEEVSRDFAERGKARARLFTWENTAQKTWQAYERFSA